MNNEPIDFNRPASSMNAAEPAHAVPVAGTPPVVAPPAGTRARKKTWPLVASGVLIVVHCVFVVALLLGPSSKFGDLPPYEQGRLMGQAFARLVCPLFVVMGIGFLISRRSRVGVLIGCIVILGLFDAGMLNGLQKARRARAAAEMQSLSEEMRRDAQKRLENGGQAVEQKRVGEISDRMKGISDKMGGDAAKGGEVQAAWIREIAEVGAVYDRATDRAVAAGYSKPGAPATLDGLDALLARIAECRDAANTLIAKTEGAEADLRERLSAAGCGQRFIDGFVAGVTKGGRLEIAAKIRRLDVTMLEARTAQVQLLKSHFGKWRVEDEALTFTESNMDEVLREYNGHQERINAAAAAQDELQKKLIGKPS